MIKFRFLETCCYSFTVRNCQLLTRSEMKFLWTPLPFQNDQHLPVSSSELKPEALPNSCWRSNRRLKCQQLTNFSSMLRFIHFPVNWCAFLCWCLDHTACFTITKCKVIHLEMKWEPIPNISVSRESLETWWIVSWTSAPTWPNAILGCIKKRVSDGMGEVILLLFQ